MICHKGYKYSGNTSNMRFHLKDCHPLLFQGLSDDASSSSSNSSNPCGSASALPGQQRLPEMFRQQEPFSRSSSKWSKLTESLCYFLAKDSQPFDTVNGAGFQNFFMTWSLDISLLTGKLYLLHTCRDYRQLTYFTIMGHFKHLAKTVFNID